MGMTTSRVPQMLSEDHPSNFRSAGKHLQDIFAEKGQQSRHFLRPAPFQARRAHRQVPAGAKDAGASDQAASAGSNCASSVEPDRADSELRPPETAWLTLSK